MIYTLTHEPLALAAALILLIIFVATATVVVTLAIGKRTGSTGTLPGADPIGQAIDQAAALTEPDPTPRETAFARDVECWLADRDWPAPPIVPGRSEP